MHAAIRQLMRTCTLLIASHSLYRTQNQRCSIFATTIAYNAR